MSEHVRLHKLGIPPFLQNVYTLLYSGLVLGRDIFPGSWHSLVYYMRTSIQKSHHQSDEAAICIRTFYDIFLYFEFLSTQLYIDIGPM